MNLLGNWDGLPPLTGSTTTELVFAGSTNLGSAASPLLQNLANPFLLNRLTFDAGAGSFFLGGSDFRFGGTNAAITQNSSNAQSIANTIRGPSSGIVTLNLTGNGSGIVTMSGIIATGQGGGRDYSLVKSGSSTFSLTGVNTYAGGTTIDGGRLIVNNASSLGATSGKLTVNAGTLQVMTGFSTSRLMTLGHETSTVDIDAAQTFTSTGVIDGAGALNKAGAGTMVLSAANTYTGGTVALAGELQLGTSHRLADTGSVLISGGTLNLGTYSDTIGGLTLRSGSISGTGVLTASSYAVESGSISAVLAGSSSFVKSTSGTVTLTGTNTYTGGSIINAGTLVIDRSSNLGATTGGLTVNAGTLRVATGFSTIRAITLGSSASAISVDAGQLLTVSSPIVGAGTLNKSGTGTMVLSGNNTFTGGTDVQAGILRLGATERLANSGALTISGGTFDLQAYNETVGLVTLSSGSIAGTASLTSSAGFSLSSGSVTAGLSGSGALTKTGAGTVSLSRANSYTGATSVNGGLLSVGANGALGSVAAGTTVASGAALQLNNVSYSAAEPLTINGSGISNGGALVNSGTSMFWGHVTAATHSTINVGGGVLTFTGGLTKNGTTLTFAGGGTVNINTVGIGGSSPNSDLVVDGTTVVLNAANSYNGPTTVQNSGTLRLGASNVLPTAPQTALAVNTSSVFDLASYSDGVASLTGDTSGIVRNSAAGSTSTLTINPASGTSSTFAGIIAGTNGGAQGDIALEKSGSGTLELTGVNTFAGSTRVTAGTLIAAAQSGSALGSTASIEVNSGATLLLGASDQLNNAAALTLAGGTFGKGDFSEGGANTTGLGQLILTADSQIDFGSGGLGILSFAGLNTNTFSLVVENWTGTTESIATSAADRLIFNSDQSGNLQYFTFAGYAAGATQLDLGNGYFEVMPAIVPVPEPATILAGLFLLLAIGYSERRRCLSALCRVRANRS